MKLNFLPFFFLSLANIFFLQAFSKQSFDSLMTCIESDRIVYEKMMSKLPFLYRTYLQTIRKRYERFLDRLNNQYSHENRIPCIIHQIWLGNKPVPEELKVFMEELRKMHPHWDYKLWTDADIKNLDLITQKYFNQEEHPRSRANLLRIELLFKFGGVYVDLDCLCIKPFDTLHKTCDFYCGALEIYRLENNLFNFRCNNAIIGSRARHQILQYFLKNVIPQRRKYPVILHRTGVDALNQTLLETFNTNDDFTVILPSRYFYPFYKLNKQVKYKVFPETYVIHWYQSNYANLAKEIALLLKKAFQ